MLAVFCPAAHVVKHFFFIARAHQDEIVSTDCPNCTFTAAKIGPWKVSNTSTKKGPIFSAAKKTQTFPRRPAFTPSSCISGRKTKLRELSSCHTFTCFAGTPRKLWVAEGGTQELLSPTCYGVHAWNIYEVHTTCWLFFVQLLML